MNLKRARAYPVIAPKKTTDRFVIEDTTKLLKIALTNGLVDPVDPNEKTIL